MAGFGSTEGICSFLSVEEGVNVGGGTCCGKGGSTWGIGMGTEGGAWTPSGALLGGACGGGAIFGRGIDGSGPGMLGAPGKDRGG